MTEHCKGMVAAGHIVTANAAAEILADGGNAFDAALAGLFAACVPECVLASPGGGGFLMAHVARRNETVLYDFFVNTPQRVRPPETCDFESILVDFGPETQEFHVGCGATAVAGFVPGVFAVHEDLGRLPMRRIMEPAIRTARDGVAMNAYHSYLFSIIPPILTRDPAAAAIFAREGKLLGKGGIFRNPQLAGTFAALAEEGARLFVDGEIGHAIAGQAEGRGGHLTLNDLRAYRVERRVPLTCRYQGHSIHLNPAPAASGPLIALAFGLLSGLDDTQRKSPDWMARVMAAANEARITHAETLAAVADPAVIAKHLGEMSRHAPAPRGTTHISVIDSEGNAAAATVSNGEGNGQMVGHYGFMMNNMLGEEDINPGGFHKWRPGTRMSTMMAPAIIDGGEGALAALGSGGSNRIRSAILQVACNLIDHGMTCVEAVTAPRMHVEKCGNLSFEAQLSSEAQALLLAEYPAARIWPEPNMFFGGVHAARRSQDGCFDGAGDPRREGAAVAAG